MNSQAQSGIELSAVLNLVPYLDTDFNYNEPVTLADLVKYNEDKFSGDETFELLKAAVENNEQYAKIELVDQSSTNSTGKWTDDLIQGCTFRDANGNYYVAYRGTGDGRWADNGKGMAAESTEMQRAAAEYFDAMAEKYFIDAKRAGKEITVTGHSKGGNEAQYVYMAARYEELIDNCYSIDGQGFSKKAIKAFIERYGEDAFKDKLEKMYSICGENDYVHDLGYVIIPEENTYFVPTQGDGFESYHALKNMLIDKDGNYTNLNWVLKNGEVSKGEQGEIGKLAKELSKAMMKLDEDDLDGAAVATMSLIEKFIGGEPIGEVEADFSDYMDLFADGVPAVLGTLLTTEAGLDFISGLLSDYLKDAKVAEVIGWVAAIGLLTPVIIKYLPTVVTIINFIDNVCDQIKKIVDVSKKVIECVSKIKEIIIETINKLNAKLKKLTKKNANPIPQQIKLDTYKLTTYASRLSKVNGRINTLDRRLDRLYGQVGLLGLWNLMQADLLTGYSWRLNRCASYLNTTATNFNTVENKLKSSL